MGAKCALASSGRAHPDSVFGLRHIPGPKRHHGDLLHYLVHWVINCPWRSEYLSGDWRPDYDWCRILLRRPGLHCTKRNLAPEVETG